MYIEGNVNRACVSSRLIDDPVQNIVNIPNSVHHPKKCFVFPKTKSGKRERSCQHIWFENFRWLHYDVVNDSVFCFYCMTHKRKLTAEHNKDDAYITKRV